MNPICKKYIQYDYLYRKRCLHEQELNQLIELKYKNLRRLYFKKDLKYFQRLCIFATAVSYANCRDEFEFSFHDINQEIGLLKDQINRTLYFIEKNRIHKEQLKKLMIAWQCKVPEIMRTIWEQFEPQQDDLLPFEQLQLQYKKDYHKGIQKIMSKSPYVKGEKV